MPIIGTAICIRTDPFSRRVGRSIAFRDALMKCGALNEYHDGLVAEFNRRFPYPVPQARPARKKLPPEEIERLRAEGWPRKGKA